MEVVGKEAFYGCTDLNVIDISHTSVKELQNGAFGKSGISSISLPSTFRIVGASAFIETKNLKELTLPEGSEVIDLEAFSGSSIQKVTFRILFTTLTALSTTVPNLLPSKLTEPGQHLRLLTGRQQ